ncbi:hypothetical protein [Methanolacinia petrolearia]|uniref:hypothetical protein n=1 Tax=Methanolacinia petrolearia TaxID=54120 RepID=UPI003BAA6189
MNHRGPAKDLDKVFFLILLITLLSNSLIYLFVFALNWEAWFFGMKVDGLDAGIILFTYFLISTILAFLLFRYPRRIPEIALMSIFFLGSNSSIPQKLFRR